MRSAEIPSLGDGLAKRHVLLRTGIPVRKHHDRFGAALEPRVGREIARVDRIVLGVRSVDRGGEAEPGVLDAEIGGGV